MPPTWHGAKNITFFGNTPLLLCSFKWGLLYHSSALQGKMTTYKGWPIQATPHRSVHPSICWNSASIHGKMPRMDARVMVGWSHLKTTENEADVIIRTVFHNEGMGCLHIPGSHLQVAIIFTNHPFKIRSGKCLDGMFLVANDINERGKSGLPINHQAFFRSLGHCWWSNETI